MTHTPVNEFVINNYISMRFVNNRTYIYINGEKYIQCMRLLFTTTKNTQFTSIDYAEYSEDVITDEIDPEEEFIGHCSNMQVFAENNYDTRLLHRSIAFPLLKKLYDVNDDKAKKVFITELKKRCEHGHPKTIIYLIENEYLKYLPDEWFVTQLNDSNSQVVENLIYWIHKNDNEYHLVFRIFHEFIHHISEAQKKIIYKKINKTLFDSSAYIVPLKLALVDSVFKHNELL